MGQLTTDKIRVHDGTLFFIPSGSTSLGISQSVNSVAQQYVVTMSGASLSQSVLAPANATASFWYFRTPDTHSVKVFYQNTNHTSVEPTGSTLGLRDLPNLAKPYISASTIQVNLPMGISGSEITSRTISALRSSRFGINRYTISASGYFTTSFGQGEHLASGSGFYNFIHILNTATGTPPIDDIDFSHMSGSSILYNVPVSGSGALHGLAGEGTPDTGSATVQLELVGDDKHTLRTGMQNSHSVMRVDEGYFAVNVANSATGSGVSLHGGAPVDYGDTLPNNPYIKTNAGFDFLLDNANAHYDHKFRVWTGTGIATVAPGTKLMEIDNSGSMWISGSLSGGTF
jgi:hypothetical protein